MKNLFIIILNLATILCGIFSVSQDIQYHVGVINIEIPVRVFKGDVFISNLVIQDFEVFEDGRPQKIEALYLINKKSIQQEETNIANIAKEYRKIEQPQLTRQSVLFFEMSDYFPEIDKMLDYYFKYVLLSGDSLIVVTPKKIYLMREEALSKKTKDEVKVDLRRIIRRDILMGGGEYRNTIAELRRTLLEARFGNMEESLEKFAICLSNLNSLRRVNEKGLLDFAAYLKNLPGQKYIYMFYQKEMIPQFNLKTLINNEIENQGNPSTTMKFLEMFELFNRDISFNVDAVKKAYADSSISVHFIMVTKTPAIKNDVEYRVDPFNPGAVEMVERSEDIYSAFGEVARATGGIVDSSANAAAAFARAVDASENYYLIYYKPIDYKADGKFHEIKVRVNGGYRVTHRAGYIAK
jgi:VWFA-related protein